MAINDVELSPAVAEKLRELYEKVFGSEQETMRFLDDPGGAFAAHDIDPSVLGNTDISQLVNSCAYPAAGTGTSPSAGGTGGGSAGGATGGGASGGGYTPPPQTVQQVTEVTKTYYEDHSTHIDNSMSVEADEIHGDVDMDATNVTATGDGAVAAGDDAKGVATGDGAVAAGEDIEDSQVSTGDGNVLAGEDISAPVVMGPNTGIVADGRVEDSVAGDNTGTFVGGSADGAVFGDNTGLAGGIDIDNDSGGTGTGGAGSGGPSTGGSGTGGNAGDAQSSGSGGGGGGPFGLPNPFGGGGGGSGSASSAGGTGIGGDAGDSTGTGGAGTGGGGGGVHLDLNFGGGNENTGGGQQNVGGQQVGGDVDESAVGGQDAENVADNTIDEGSAAATGGGEATGEFEETTETTDTHAHDQSVIEQGPGDQTVDAEAEPEDVPAP